MTKRHRPDRSALTTSPPAGGNEGGREYQSETARLIRESRQRQADSQPTAGRGKPAHAGRLGKDKRGRAKLTADVSLDIQAALRNLSETEEVSISDLVEIACRSFLDAHTAGLIDLYPFKIPARSLRYAWKLDIPAEINFFPETGQP